jgi:hypothetical protein
MVQDYQRYCRNILRGFLSQKIKKRRPTSERKKPDFIPNAFVMDHVPPPNPENYWKLKLNDPRVVMVDQVGTEIVPMMTITVREIKGDEVSLQITFDPRMQTFYKQ